MHDLTVNIRQSRLTIVLVALGCLPLLWMALRHFDAIQWFGIFLLPFILRIEKGVIGGRFFLIISILFGLFYLTLGQDYWAFASGLSIIYHLIHTRIGKLNAIAFYTIIFYLPLTRSFFTLFGFYIRMEITKWAGWLLSVFNDNVSFIGSRIWVDGNEFTVDAGCMGLRLVITGFILSLLILQQVAKKKKIKPTRWHITGFLGLSLLLVIAANFFRILITIQFQSPANSWSHELIGLGTFFLFHLVPMYVLVNRFLPQTNSDRNLPTRTVTEFGFDLWLLGMLITLMLAKTVFAPNKMQFTDVDGLNRLLCGYELTVLKDGVHRYSNSNSTLIIKPMFPLSFSNHHPMLCWRGDGFEVIGEDLSNLGELNCFRADLLSDGQQLKTAWWYVNEDGAATTSELEWRWNAIVKRQHYFLVNLSAVNEDQLLFSSVQTQNGQLVFDPIP